MKKRWMALLIGMLFPAAAFAQGDMVSIAQLREQAQEMGRWTQTYEARGRTIEVDVPVIVPQADELPVVTVEEYDTMIETLAEENPACASSRRDRRC